MEIRSGKLPSSVPSEPSPLILYSLLVLWLSVLGGCAAPAEPSARRASVPEGVTDLAASQAGDDVVLTFTLPKNSVTREPLTSFPTIEIYRDLTTSPASGNPTRGALKTLIATIPQAVVDRYLDSGRIRYVDSLRPEDLKQYSGGEAVYSVRTRVSKKRESADSNLVVLHLQVPAEPIQDPSAEVTRSAIKLSWTAPTKTTTGAPLSAPVGYRVYRAEAESGASASDVSPEKLESWLTLLAETDVPSYGDTRFEFGHSYMYSVRSVVRIGTEATESADSKFLVVNPTNIFPPSAPLGLVVVYVPALGATPEHLELSWSISPEQDIAGYNVYRSEESVASARLNPQLLLTPEFRDMSAVSGHRYTYSVTAVDRAGNESSASSAVSAGFPDSSQ